MYHIIVFAYRGVTGKDETCSTLRATNGWVNGYGYAYVLTYSFGQRLLL